MHQRQRGLHARVEIGHPPRRARRAGEFGRFSEVERRGPHQHGTTAGRGLDQILAAQRRKAAAEQRGIGHAVIKGHLAERIAQPQALLARLGQCARRRAQPFAAPRNPQSRGLQRQRHRLEALRMARHHQPLHFERLGPEPAQGVNEQCLLAFAAAGQHHHRTRRTVAPLRALRQLRGIGQHIELEIAQHAVHRRRQCAQALRIGLGLGPDRGQRLVGRHGQRRQLQGLVQRLAVEPRIGQRQRHAARAADRGQVGPDFGFHQHADGGPELRNEALDGAARIPGLPDLQIAAAQQLLAFGAARGRAVREQQAHVGQLRAQRGDQDRRGARLAQRNRMHPDPAARAIAPQAFGLVMAKAFLDLESVARLGTRALAQLAPQQRLRRPGQRRIQRQYNVHCTLPTTARCTLRNWRIAAWRHRARAAPQRWARP